MLLQLKQIKKGYGQPTAPNFRPVLNSLNLTVHKGEKIAIIGPSGSGKTTLLNLIGALDNPDQGTIIFNGDDITAYNTKQLARFRNTHVGFVFQLHHLMPHLTLMENVLLPLLAQVKKISVQQQEWAEYLIHKLGVWDQRKQKTAKLSGGECQRTAVVRALINKPQLLLADEPTGALDEANAEILKELLLDVSYQHKVTLIAVTHAASLAGSMDKSYMLKGGRLV